MIKLVNVSKIYASRDAVAIGIRKINCELNIGEFIAVTGESGSGKSTFLNVISGMDTYEEGEMYINGIETGGYVLSDWEAYRNNYVSFIFQDYKIIDSYTVLQNVEVALMKKFPNAKERKEKALSLIEKVGLTSHLKHKSIKLSGGQKQRVAIARALAKDAPIIIADEPTGNLDENAGKEVMKLLHDLSRDKLVVVVTHNYDEIKQYATRKIRFYDGSIVEDVLLKDEKFIVTKDSEVVETIPNNKGIQSDFDYVNDNDNENGISNISNVSQCDLDNVDSFDSNDNLIQGITDKSINSKIKPKFVNFHNYLKIAWYNLLSTPKKTVFLACLFLISISLLIFATILPSVSPTNKRSIYPYYSDNRIIVQRNDYENLQSEDFDAIRDVIKDATLIENDSLAKYVFSNYLKGSINTKYNYVILPISAYKGNVRKGTKNIKDDEFFIHLTTDDAVAISDYNKKVDTIIDNNKNNIELTFVGYNMSDENNISILYVTDDLYYSIIFQNFIFDTGNALISKRITPQIYMFDNSLPDNVIATDIDELITYSDKSLAYYGMIFDMNISTTLDLTNIDFEKKEFDENEKNALPVYYGEKTISGGVINKSNHYITMNVNTFKNNFAFTNCSVIAENKYQAQEITNSLKNIGYLVKPTYQKTDYRLGEKILVILLYFASFYVALVLAALINLVAKSVVMSNKNDYLVLRTLAYSPKEIMGIICLELGSIAFILYALIVAIFNILKYMHIQAFLYFYKVPLFRYFYVFLLLAFIVIYLSKKFSKKIFNKSVKTSFKAQR